LRGVGEVQGSRFKVQRFNSIIRFWAGVLNKKYFIFAGIFALCASGREHGGQRLENLT